MTKKYEITLCNCFLIHSTIIFTNASCLPLVFVTFTAGHSVPSTDGRHMSAEGVNVQQVLRTKYETGNEEMMLFSKSLMTAQRKSGTNH